MIAAAEPTNAGIEVLVPLLQNYLEAADRDRDATREIIKELKQAIESMRECTVNMKLQLREIETHFTDFDQSCMARKLDCGEKFMRMDDQCKAFAEQLNALPSAKELEKREKKLDTLIEKVNALVIRVYVIIGVAAGVFAFVKWALPLIVK